MATGTLFETSGVESEQETVSYHSPVLAHIKQSIRSLIAIFAQVLLWYGMCSLYWCVCLSGDSTCDNYSSNWWKNLFLVAMGLLLMGSTNTFLSSEEDEESEDAEDEASSKASQCCRDVEHSLRAVVAIFAAILHNVGIWSE